MADDECTSPAEGIESEDPVSELPRSLGEAALLIADLESLKHHMDGTTDPDWETHKGSRRLSLGRS